MKSLREEIDCRARLRKVVARFLAIKVWIRKAEAKLDGDFSCRSRWRRCWASGAPYAKPVISCDVFNTWEGGFFANLDSALPGSYCSSMSPEIILDSSKGMWFLPMILLRMGCWPDIYFKRVVCRWDVSWKVWKSKGGFKAIETMRHWTLLPSPRNMQQHAWHALFGTVRCAQEYVLLKFYGCCLACD